MIRGHRGSMLVAAVWALLLLGTFSISLSFGVRQKAALLQRVSALDAVYPIAYSGVETARGLIHSDADKELDAFGDIWAFPPPQEVAAAGKFQYVTDGGTGIVDEQRKVNLNKTSPEILVRLLRDVSGLPEAKADDLAYSLLDWIDSDEFFGHPQYGAEDRYYKGLDVSYEAKDAPFEVIDELLLVKGLTAEVFEKIRPFVTIYGNGRVNVNTAPRAVLYAMGFSAEAVAHIDRCRVGEDGKNGTADDTYFTSASQIPATVMAVTGRELDVSQTVVLDGLIAADRVGVGSEYFSVTSRGVLASSGASADVEAVLDEKGRVWYQRAMKVTWPSRQ